MKNQLKWEFIYRDEYREGWVNHFNRAKVPGGWLVHSETFDNGNPVSQSMAFVPDDNHVWQERIE